MSTKRPAWLPPLTEADARANRGCGWEGVHDRAQASVILALEGAGLLEHGPIPHPTKAAGDDAKYCRACACLAWARAITGGA